MVCHSLYDRRMRVGLSLLTLVPGHLGRLARRTRGSSAARSPASAATDYEVLVPTLAPEAGDGLETVVATGYPASTTIPGRLRAMAGASMRPAPSPIG